MLIIYFFIFLLIVWFYNRENMTNNYNKYLDESKTLIVDKEKYDHVSLIEITNLPSCNKNFTISYGSNYNNIVNDNKSVFIDIIDPLLHTIEIDNQNYNLLKIEWVRNNFQYNGREVGLCLQLVHTNYLSPNQIKIVFPLNLIANQSTEAFENLFYNKTADLLNNGGHYDWQDLNDIQDLKFDFNKQNIQNSFSDIGDLDDEYSSGQFNLLLDNQEELNNLLDINDIPIYQCCKNTIGNYMNTNLCNVAKLSKTINKFYTINEENGNTCYITDPINFDESIGFEIRKKIIFDTNIYYLV